MTHNFWTKVGNFSHSVGCKTKSVPRVLVAILGVGDEFAAVASLNGNYFIVPFGGFQSLAQERAAKISPIDSVPATIQRRQINAKRSRLSTFFNYSFSTAFAMKCRKTGLPDGQNNQINAKENRKTT